MIMKKIKIKYYAILREQRGLSQEKITTDCPTPRELYADLKLKHNFSLPENMMKVSINNAFTDWSAPLADGDSLIFIPPVAGG